jgi:SAM-dependent methyltransferase
MRINANPARKHDTLSIIEGFYLAEITYQFHKIGLLQSLTHDRSLKNLARQFRYDERALAAVLEFLYQSTDILVRNGTGRYLLKRKYRNFYFLGFQLEKFIGAYGPTVMKLGESLRSPRLGRGFVAREIEARAYRTIASPPNPVVLELAKKLKLKSILDLGCGPATLLTELCRRDSHCLGWGIDESAEMCRVARRRIGHAHLAARIRVVHGDARNLSRYFDRSVRTKIEALQSKGLFNELFRAGNSQAIRYLKKLKRWFPGKLLFVVDYYGKLTRVPNIKREYQHTLVHDLIQVLTAQGVPPANLKGWAALYGRAGCYLEHAYEGDSQGIEWFVHVVRL